MNIAVGDLAHMRERRSGPVRRAMLRIAQCVKVKQCLEFLEDWLAWAVKVTDEYAVWFTTLIKEDLKPATQVAQAVASLREEGKALGRSLVDG